MDKKDKILIEAYLNESLENLEISAGRILLDSDFETTKAGINELDEAKKAARLFFNKKFKEIRSIVCEKYKDQVLKLNNTTEKSIELAGYIAAILESNNISVGPLNYIFISVWVVKNGIDELCQESTKGQ